VVRSLADDDHLAPAQIAKLLGRGRGWVDRRLTLGRRLAPEVGRHVDAGRLSATTATTLSTLPRRDQPHVADAILRHGVRTREAEALVAAWRAASDAPTREALLRDPRSAVPAPSVGPCRPWGRWRASSRCASIRPSGPSRSCCRSTSPASPTPTGEPWRLASGGSPLRSSSWPAPFRRRPPMLTPEEQQELQRLVQEHIPIRAIARRLGRDVKTIRRALGRPPQPPGPSKLAPYPALAQALAAQTCARRGSCASSGRAATRGAPRP
jgi:Helix-turn-helix domain